MLIRQIFNKTLLKLFFVCQKCKNAIIVCNSKRLIFLSIENTCHLNIKILQQLTKIKCYLTNFFRPIYENIIAI